MTKITGNRQLAEMLRDYGVSHVFFVPTILMESLAAMEDMGIQRILTHGEKAAVYMADGYARAARRPSVCLAQQIGASNLAAGEPLPARLPGRRGLQPIRARDQDELPGRGRAPAA